MNNVLVIGHLQRGDQPNIEFGVMDVGDDE